MLGGTTTRRLQHQRGLQLECPMLLLTAVEQGCYSAMDITAYVQYHATTGIKPPRVRVGLVVYSKTRGGGKLTWVSLYMHTGRSINHSFIFGNDYV